MPSLGKLKALFEREFLIVERDALMLLLIILLPVAFGIMFASFKQVIPKSTPASVIPESSEVSEVDLRFAAFSVLSQFCSPSIDSREEAFRKLSREEVYFVVSIPEGVREGRGTVKVYVDNSLSPVAELSNYVVEILTYELGQVGFHPEISVEKLGKPILPIEYFTPGVVMFLLATAGILIVPFNTVKDRNIISRVLSSVTLGEFVASKLFFSLLLASLQIAILLISQSYLELPILSINPLSILTMILASLALTTTGLLIAFAFKLSNIARYVCSFLFGFITTFSGLFYPPGFLPLYLQPIPKILPTYYALILLRSFSVKGEEAGVFLDYFVIVLLWLVASLILLHYFARRFRHG
jgi:ABC-2 type transport system permease protein